MIGLPGSGKTQWVKNHLAANTDKNYTVIGNHPLFDRMTVSQFGKIVCFGVKKKIFNRWKVSR